MRAKPLAPDRVAEGGGSFGVAVRHMFNILAPRYDSFNHWASLGMDFGWRRAAVRALQLPSDALVLDVATGTGDLAFAAARGVRRAVGCDFAVEMIAVARTKSGVANNVSFQVARAEALPYGGERFDGVTSAFAMRNVKPVLDQVLVEMFRVLRPGGRVAILEFSRPRHVPLRWAHGLYTRSVMPRVGRWLTGTAEPFEYLYRSIRAWLAPAAFAEQLQAAGFRQVTYRMMGLGTVALHRGQKPL
ncbi:MAG: ubiquinone/menaquinone biosynthesis methyltransferase [Acidobacteriota bacterium]